MKTEQKAEMTVEEFEDKWAWLAEQLNVSSEFLSDFRNVIRGELIKFKDYVNNTFCEGNLSNLLDTEDVDEFLNNNQ